MEYFINAKFQNHTQITIDKFESMLRLYNAFYFFGAQIETDDESVAFIWKKYYVRTLELFYNKKFFDNFRRDRALFSWPVNNLPDLACIANRAAQVTYQTYDEGKFSEVNKLIRILMN